MKKANGKIPGREMTQLFAVLTNKLMQAKRRLYCSQALLIQFVFISFTMRGLSTLKVLFPISLMIASYSTALRFCYSGEWHQTGPTCSLGIAFIKPVPIYCAYEDDSSVASTTSFQPDICYDKLFHMDSFNNLHPTKSVTLAHNLPQLQVIYHHVAGDKDDVDNFLRNATKEFPDVVDLSECVESCGDGGLVRKELDPSSDSFSSEEAGAVLDPEEVQALKEQTLRLGDYMYDITVDHDGSDFIVQLDYRIVDLFKRSFDVISATCPDPFLPHEFNTRVLNGFLFLLSDSGTDLLKDITEEEYQDIRDALDGCRSERPRFVLEGKICSGKALVERIVTNQDDGHRKSYDYKQDNQLDHFKYDLFIDAAWKVIDIVHAACFVQFLPNVNMHHRYQTAMESLFTNPIQRRWQNPTKLINNDAWASWLLVDINSTLLNLFACQRAAYMGTPFSMRLDRPFHKYRYRRDLSSVHSSWEEEKKSHESTKNLISTATTESYWRDYESSGGIQAKLAGQIYCFKSEGWLEGRGEIVEQLRLDQCGATKFSSMS